ncbi:LpxI family protein [Pseudoponticoccus marisrubri]|uniref:Phosphatidate cytidylyltransferase n=1 Tax=Pseudoponticoccus marisrubri TaxID=1685382 RepID=A0A0W7WMU0_9RHOB|nr:UDP-2,3-diacylglucosamine diphosphatase LpxI [Pseudoponticoccus marisrubri]KUF11907.1 hypothetical protein AVJ23_04825 [Pseudoponticoccus marisrubri]
MLALIAGRGALPVELNRALSAGGRAPLVATLEGVGSDLPTAATWRSFRIEHLGSVLQDLRAAGVTEICFAGAIARPALDPAQIDAATAPLVERILKALSSGDDAALRAVMGLFEEAGMAVRAAHEICPELVAPAGFAAGPQPLPEAVEPMIGQGAAILQALSPLDVGQSVVIGAAGCLGIETAQGTDALLGFVATSEPRFRRGPAGVLVKGPKLGQDLRVDMPAIGPDTLRHAARGGLGAIVVQAGRTLLLDREALLAEAEAQGVTVVARELGL